MDTKYYSPIEKNTYTLEELKRKHTNIIFGVPVSQGVLEYVGCVELTPAPIPEADVVIAGQPEQDSDGSWREVWIGRPYTEIELSDRLQSRKSALLGEINDAYDASIYSLVSTYPDREIATFTKQEEEAVDWLNDPTTPTPFIDGMLVTRDIEKAELVRRILAKAEAFADASGQLTGKRQALEKEVENAKTLEELEAVQW